jgi:VWFA-related protein
MIRAWLCCLLASLCVPVIAAGQSSPAEPAGTVRVNTNLVVVDVVVTDAHHNPVHNLTAADFTPLEDGHTQTIQTFEEHTAGETAKLPQLPPLPKLEPGVFTNYSPVPAADPLSIVLLDRLNTPFQDQPYSSDQLLEYLKHAPAGTRIAIFGLTSQLFLVHGFSADTELLGAALHSKKGAPMLSPLLNNPVSGDDAEAVLGKPGQEGGQVKHRLRRRQTLEALNQLGRYLGQLPGRKNLLWFSGSFPISILPLRPGHLGISSISDEEFREQTINLLAHSGVAVYPIDARGLIGSPWVDAANRAPPDVTALLNNVGQSANQAGNMNEIAEATGGKAFMNTNGLKEAVGKAIEAGSNYYTLTYSPPKHKEKGEYCKIHIKVARAGVTLAYRRGYYAEDANTRVHRNEIRTDSTDPPPYSAMRAAMLFGSPEPSEIRFEANVRPSNANTEPAVAPDNEQNAEVKGPYRRYNVNYTVNRGDIQCPSAPEGARTCVLEFVTCVYGADGTVVNAQSNRVRATFQAAQYAAVPHDGLPYWQQISVPAKGEYFLRIGVHDVTADRVGALELPVSAVSLLPPLSANSAKPASSLAETARTEQHYTDDPRGPGDYTSTRQEREEKNDLEAHPYLEEAVKQLTKRIPELRGIRSAADQHELPMILNKTGENVDDFFNNAVDLVANEKINQERLGSFGDARPIQPVRDSYLILRHVESERTDFEEFRMDAKGNRIDEGGPQKGFAVTSGFALICRHFSTAFQPDSTFRYLGEQKISGRETYVVAFAQRPSKARLAVTMKGPTGTATHMMTQGIAWVDKENFHILRMRTDLLARQPEIGLDEQTTRVDFSEVRLADLTTPLWLPRDVNVYVKLANFGNRHFEEAFRNVHQYTNYQRYRVSTKIMVPQ